MKYKNTLISRQLFKMLLENHIAYEGYVEGLGYVYAEVVVMETAINKNHTIVSTHNNLMHGVLPILPDATRVAKRAVLERSFLAPPPKKPPQKKGMWVVREVAGIKEYYFDRTVDDASEVRSKYRGEITPINSGQSLITGDSKGNKVAQYVFWNNSYDPEKFGALSDEKGNLLPDNKIIYGKDYTIFGTSDNSVDPRTLHQNLWNLPSDNSYTGPDNPKTYGGKENLVEDSYQYRPRNRSEYGSMDHDISYKNKGAAGIMGALFNTDVIGADIQLAGYNYLNAVIPGTTWRDRGISTATAVTFTGIAANKIMVYPLLSPLTQLGLFSNSDSK